MRMHEHQLRTWISIICTAPNFSKTVRGVQVVLRHVELIPTAVAAEPY
jgi:hypothetical protein